MTAKDKNEIRKVFAKFNDLIMGLLAESTSEGTAPAKRRGRPPKNGVSAAPKRGPGRPRKMEAAADAPKPERKKQSKKAMQCRATVDDVRCVERSRGPRFRYLCTTHADWTAPDVAE